MHYRLPGLSLDQITGIGTVDEWLSTQPHATRLSSDRLELDAATLPAAGARQVEAFTLPGQRLPGPGAPAPGKAAAAEARRKGELAAAEGDTTTALAQFELCASLDPEDADVLEKIGFLQLGAARPDRALEFFGKAVASASAGTKIMSMAWLGTGMALDLQNQRDQAKAAYRKVIDLGINDEHQLDEARGYLENPYREDG
jgi:tetratricopeptide (TPR) repeat protein